MLKTISNACGVCSAALGKIKKVSKPTRNFIVHILCLWLSMNCRYVFTNMQRWGTRVEKSYREMFKKFFDWFSFNYELIKQYADKEIICVFDPAFIKKSGKRTFGIGKFWSGVACKALKGLEVGCLCFVDVTAATALHALAEQTPSAKTLQQKGKTLIDHYAGVIKKHVKSIKQLTGYLAVDGYFMKKQFIQPLVKEGLHVITKMRQDANLKYLYRGKQRKGKGRPKVYDGKVDVKAIDKGRIKCCYQDSKVKVYSSVLYAVQLKRNVLVAFLYCKNKQTPEIIVSTDTEMGTMQMCRYYGLRFQVEFLIRDAKQYTGLEDCQARSQRKLHTHFNIALTAVSLAKVAYWLPLPNEQRGSFSMADIKMWCMNQLITNRIFSNLNVDLNSKKIKQLYQDCLNFGRLRA